MRQVDRAIDASSRMFMARLELPNPGHLLPVGTRCQADLVRATAGLDRTAQ